MDTAALERFVAQVQGGAAAEVVLGSERHGLVGRRFRLTARPAFEGHGHAGRIDGTVADVTVVSNAALARARLAAAFDATDQGVCVTDAAQRIVLINPAFTTITGYSAAEERQAAFDPRLRSSGRDVLRRDVANHRGRGAVADRLREAVRASDLVARIGSSGAATHGRGQKGGAWRQGPNAVS
ncbi:MAG: hypothetical protein RIT45_1218 [Pseudomonadota bacterium]|jgi:PAS domain-containing protein